ncbi:type VI secretion system-associated FHA domain protein TagH [Meridianimarinicoccus aquatilis]|uniref:Type VI secretion system-associated FHA domain protein TagH n=1 Tax=Meridianimarinicoccus aquatilis TaxID=2552766 RepID=A0A4R6AP92_9RHOB|nr:type VI secretion system-associated FHA domain protein TagH [Fluviibacterium aquatile]TDL85194.1 type VI secretion system-associated FHA domain protein TagH [Fluviibacterium aquatile]
MAVTVHFQSTGTVPGDGRPVTMIGDAMTIGRSADNDLMLPDPSKGISKRHCAIEINHGIPVAIDLSTNGTFLNYGKAPIGEVSAPLNDGDVLTIGSYELLIEITEAKTAVDPHAVPLADTPPAGALSDILGGSDDGGDFLDDLLGEGAPVTGPSSVQRKDDFDEDGLLPPLGDDEDDLLGPVPEPQAGLGASQGNHSASAEDHFRPSTISHSVIPDEWNPDDLLGDEPLTPPGDIVIPDDPFAESEDEADLASPVADKGIDDPEEPTVTPVQSTAQPSPRPMAQPEPTTPSQSGTDVAARAFLKTAGGEGLNLSDEDLIPTLSRMGHVMRILVKGLREVLMTRTSIKSEFRIQQTVIGSGGNNPLKFSVSPEQALEAMIKPPATGYLDPVDAAEQALKDIKAHEIAMMTGMEAALKDVLRQLSPDELEKQMQTSGGLGGLLKGRKARYWEVYEKMYAEISDRAENEFHEMFSREFARAYQAQLERLK